MFCYRDQETLFNTKRNLKLLKGKAVAAAAVVVTAEKRSNCRTKDRKMPYESRV